MCNFFWFGQVPTVYIDNNILNGQYIYPKTRGHKQPNLHFLPFLAHFVELKLKKPSLSWSLSWGNIFQNIYNLHMLQVLFCYLHSNKLILHKISYLLLLYNVVLYFKLAEGFKNRKSTVTVRTPKIILTCTQTLWDAKNSKYGCLTLSSFNEEWVELNRAKRCCW